MGTAAHLGIRLRDYDARIRTFIPHYEDMLDAAAAALEAVDRHAPLVLDLGIGSGELAARSLAVSPRARIIGIDNDEGMLALARKRLGRCDIFLTSFALHHIPTRRQKAAFYSRCFAALRPGGLLVNADCCTASLPRLRALDRAAWRAPLQRHYGPRRAEGFLRAWGREDVYFRLEDEIALLKLAGFSTDVPWRRGAFAVVVSAKPAARRRGGTG